jgi:hypothetical protein
MGAQLSHFKQSCVMIKLPLLHRASRVSPDGYEFQQRSLALLVQQFTTVVVPPLIRR